MVNDDVKAILQLRAMGPTERQEQEQEQAGRQGGHIAYAKGRNCGIT